MLHTIESGHGLLELLQQPKKNGHFVSQASFGTDTVVFTPAGEDVVAYMQQHAEDLIKTVNDWSRLLSSVWGLWYSTMLTCP